MKRIISYDELICLVNEKGIKSAAAETKAVLLATYQSVLNCSLNFSIHRHFDGIMPNRFYLNKIPIYLGLGPDNYLVGSNLPQYDDPLNSHYPGEFRYGSGHLMEALLQRESIELVASGYITDVHPKQMIQSHVKLSDFHDAFFKILIPTTKKAYSYVNTSGRHLYSEFGPVKQNSLTINYGTNGFFELMSMLPNLEKVMDVFVSGAKGILYKNQDYIFLTADFKALNPHYFQGISLQGYGVGAFLGLGIIYPISHISELEMIYENERRPFDVYDISRDREWIGATTYHDLKQDSLILNDHIIRTSSLISHQRIQEIYQHLFRDAV